EDAVVGDFLLDALEEVHRIDERPVGLGARGDFVVALLLAFAQLLEPGAVRSRLGAARELDEEMAGVRLDGNGGLAVLLQRLGVEVDADEAALLVDLEAVAEAEVEGEAGHDDHVGLLERGAALVAELDVAGAAEQAPRRAAEEGRQTERANGVGE